MNNAADAALVSYKYDYRGRRVARKVGTATTTYLYDGDQVITDYTGTGTTWRKRYYYGMGIDQPICSESGYPMGGTTYLKFYYYDGLGSVVALANYYGQIAEKYTYDVYGKPTTRNAQGVLLPASDVNNRYLFTGREYDPCVGIYYYRARYYHPTIGRFMSRDPIGYEDGMNLYKYVNNNPVNGIDPFGLITCGERCDRLYALDIAACGFKYAIALCHGDFVIAPVKQLICTHKARAKHLECIEDCGDKPVI